MTVGGALGGAAAQAYSNYRTGRSLGEGVAIAAATGARDGAMMALVGEGAGAAMGKLVSRGTDAAVRSPSFIVNSRGTAVPVPKGATGPHPTRASGVQFTGGSGGHGMHPNTNGVRYMDATAHHSERVVYMNGEGQTINPQTGRVVPPSDPAAHLKP